MNTVFNLAETCLVAALIHHFESKDDTECRATGWVRAGKEVTFAQVFKVIIAFPYVLGILSHMQLQDIRSAIDDMHVDSLLLKKTCIANLTKYVKKDDRLPGMLERIRASGRKTFLLTNSDWWYTKHIMTYLLGDEDQTNQGRLDI